MSKFGWWPSHDPLWWSLAGGVLGAVLMAPIGSEIRDGTIGCTNCGKFTETLIGFHVRSANHALFVVGGVLAGVFVGFMLALTWRLIRRDSAN
jgi:hypothetical protein